ncbi:MAG: T9SS type A sorting domain-containing protein [Chitinophagaceae bacterium]
MKLVHFLLFPSFFYLPALGQKIAVPLFSPAVDTGSAVIILSAHTVRKDNYILLKWAFEGLGKDIFFNIERSYPGKEFEVIAVLKASADKIFYEFVDEKPGTRNTYRVKMVMPDRTVYSSVITAGITGGRVFCTIYPNPVDRLLIVRSDFSIHLRIIDEVGKLRVSRPYEPGLHLVDLSELEKGIYSIHLSQKESNRIITQKLVKH